MAHESGELQRLVENLSYTAARLCAVWPNRFATVDAAQPYERNPERLANYVYARRLGNGRDWQQVLQREVRVDRELKAPSRPDK